MLATGTAQQLLKTALDAIQEDGGNWRSTLDGLPVPVYTTAPDGAVTYWNQACVDFAGRQPQLGKDRWCVTWKLYTIAGQPLANDECPMAKAVREQREIRDEILIAERPDGHRLACCPYPTPYYRSDGSLEGAVNLLVDVTDEQAESLAEQSERCKRLADATTDPKASEILTAMAREYAASVEALKG